MARILVLPTTSEAVFSRDVLESPVPALVDFTAEGCHPCARLALFLPKIALEFQGRLRILKVHHERDKALFERFNVRSFPTVIGFRNGQECARILGFGDYSRFRKELADAFLVPSGIRSESDPAEAAFAAALQVAEAEHAEILRPFSDACDATTDAHWPAYEARMARLSEDRDAGRIGASEWQARVAAEGEGLKVAWPELVALLAARPAAEARYADRIAEAARAFAVNAAPPAASTKAPAQIAASCDIDDPACRLGLVTRPVRAA